MDINEYVCLYTPADCKLTTAFAPFTSDSNDIKLFFFLILISKSVFAFNNLIVSSVQLSTSHHLFAKSDGSNTKIYLPSFFQVLIVHVLHTFLFFYNHHQIIHLSHLLIVHF